jgi:thymidine kinase
VFNGRLVGGEFVFDGEQVAIDGVEVTYESMCAKCYLRMSGGRLNR